LGQNAILVVGVKNDDLGIFYLEDLEKNNVLHSNKVSESDLSTGKSVIMITPDAERTMCTYLGVSNLLSSDDLDKSAIRVRISLRSLF